jgi:hypothetical protein
LGISKGVQAAAVNVICELARKNPKNYLSLAPTFFNLMNSSTNNWVLIKIIKLVSNFAFHLSNYGLWIQYAICLDMFEVWRIDTIRTTFGQKAHRTTHKFDTQHVGNVTLI